MRSFLIAGNWKMHGLSRDARALAQRIAWDAPHRQGVDVALFPPYTALWTVRNALAGTHVALGAQDVSVEKQGAYTGEVSAPMLLDAGCRYVLIGHSERRAMFGDTDDAVRGKTRAAVDHGLVPVVCIGETLAEREAGSTNAVLQRQVTAVFTDVRIPAADVTLAYEPVWAIGTGRTATPEIAQTAHAYIRSLLGTLCGSSFASDVRILYGGSAKADNARGLLAESDVDGLLVGGASLDAGGFVQIARAAVDAIPRR
jgi:triosephosphate isomerase